MNRRGLLGLLVGAPAAVALGGVDAVRAALSSQGPVSWGRIRAGSVGGLTFGGTSFTGYADTASITAAKIGELGVSSVGASLPRLPGASGLWAAPVVFETSETQAVGFSIRLSPGGDVIEWDSGVVIRRSGTPLGPPVAHHVSAGSLSLVGVDSAEITWTARIPELLLGRGDPLVALDEDEDDPSVPMARWTRTEGLKVYLGAESTDSSEWT